MFSGYTIGSGEQQPADLAQDGTSTDNEAKLHHQEAATRRLQFQSHTHVNWNLHLGNQTFQGCRLSSCSSSRRSPAWASSSSPDSCGIARPRCGPPSRWSSPDNEDGVECRLKSFARRRRRHRHRCEAASRMTARTSASRRPSRRRRRIRRRSPTRPRSRPRSPKRRF